MSAALAILRESGPEGFTVRAIARRANVAPMAIYNHFDGKDGLLDVIWTDGFTMLSQALAATRGEVDRDEPLFNTAHAYRRFALTHQAHYTVMFMHRFVGFTPSTMAATVAYGTFETLVELVTSAQAVGIFSGLNPADAAQILWSTCHGFVSLELLEINFALDREQTFLDILHGLLRGLAFSTN
jgi:AcrR family transcriptional regulator